MLGARLGVRRGTVSRVPPLGVGVSVPWIDPWQEPDRTVRGDRRRIAFRYLICSKNRNCGGFSCIENGKCDNRLRVTVDVKTEEALQSPCLQEIRIYF